MLSKQWNRDNWQKCRDRSHHVKVGAAYHSASGPFLCDQNRPDKQPSLMRQSRGGEIKRRNQMSHVPPGVRGTDNPPAYREARIVPGHDKDLH
jgi:hypothetical protein